MNRRLSLTGFWRGERGTTAMEFVLVLPVLVMLTIGVINLSLILYSVATVHYAAQDAARWCMIHAPGCNSTTVNTYAQARYSGLGAPTFALTTPATCAGQQVTGTATYKFVTGVASMPLPISATACHPFS